MDDQGRPQRIITQIQRLEKKCQRCDGKMLRESDIYGNWITCLNCGFTQSTDPDTHGKIHPAGEELRHPEKIRRTGQRTGQIRL